MTDIDDKPYEHVPFERGPTYAVSLPIVGQVVIDGEQAERMRVFQGRFTNAELDEAERQLASVPESECRPFSDEKIERMLKKIEAAKDPSLTFTFPVKPQPEPLRLKGYEWLGRQYVVTPIEPAILAHWWKEQGNDGPVPSAGRVDLWLKDAVPLVRLGRPTLVRLWVDWEAYQPSPDPESVAYKSVVRNPQAGDPCDEHAEKHADCPRCRFAGTVMQKPVPSAGRYAPDGIDLPRWVVRMKVR